jgi:hypothetical protein
MAGIEEDPVQGKEQHGCGKCKVGHLPPRIVPQKTHIPTWRPLLHMSVHAPTRRRTCARLRDDVPVMRLHKAIQERHSGATPRPGHVRRCIHAVGPVRVPLHGQHRRTRNCTEGSRAHKDACRMAPPRRPCPCNQSVIREKARQQHPIRPDQAGRPDRHRCRPRPAPARPGSEQQADGAQGAPRWPCSRHTGPAHAAAWPGTPLPQTATRYTCGWTCVSSPPSSAAVGPCTWKS